MKNTFKLTILSIALMSGCATTNKGRAVQFVTASDALADQVADGWDGFTSAKIDSCKSSLPPTASKKERTKCLGLASKGDELEASLAALVVAQRAVQVAVQCDSNPTKTPEELLQKCALQQAPDWLRLLTNVQQAWKKIAPFFSAMKGSK